MARRADRLKALLEARKRIAVTILPWPTWMLDEARLLARLKDGEMARVELTTCGARYRVFVLRSGGTILAAAPVGHADEADIRAWLRERAAELSEQAKRPRPAPQQANPVDDIFKP
jgi:hypothetical protein